MEPDKTTTAFDLRLWFAFAFALCTCTGYMLGSIVGALAAADVAMQRQDKSCIALNKAWVREYGYEFPCDTPYRDFLQSL